MSELLVGAVARAKWRAHHGRGGRRGR